MNYRASRKWTTVIYPNYGRLPICTVCHSHLGSKRYGAVRSGHAADTCLFTICGQATGIDGCDA